MARFAGKISGTILGLILGGWAGALLGFIVGQLSDMHTSTFHIPRLDKRDFFPDFQVDREKRAAFSLSIIMLGAKLAKVDGPITREEVLAFRHIFRTPAHQLAEVGRLFDQARLSPDGYEPYAARLAQIFATRPEILEQILASLFFIAKVDTPSLSRSEILFLRRVSVMFGFNEQDFMRIAHIAGVHLSHIQPPPKRDTAYDVLGLPTTASDDVIKRTYRALIRKHHPDKLLAAGLPASSVAEATEKMKRINAAYSEICKMRNIK